MLEIGTFRIDATPPVGQGTGFGVDGPTTGVRDPLFLRGFLLGGAGEALLVVQSDWCGLMNSAHRELSAALADGADITPDRVIIHSSHQHDAPLFDFELEAILGRPTFARDFWTRVLADARTAAREARGRMTPVADIGHAETRLWGYGSNRDVVDENGKFLGSRWSRTVEREIASAPAGTIDPMLRTAAFRDTRGRVTASWSFYASHPQVASGSGKFSADAPGEAMRIVESSLGGHDHAWFMGCAGNVTAGKYTDFHDREGNLLRFGRRMAEGILRNIQAMSWEPVDAPVLKRASFLFPANQSLRPRLEAELADPSLPVSRRHIVAPTLTALSDPQNVTYVLTRLSLGTTTILFFPGEPFVEYQLYAQAREPDRFVAAAANCGDSFLYLPRAASFALGGYEVQSFCWCTTAIEPALEKAIREVLA